MFDFRWPMRCRRQFLICHRLSIGRASFRHIFYSFFFSMLHLFFVFSSGHLYNAGTAAACEVDKDCPGLTIFVSDCRLRCFSCQSTGGSQVSGSLENHDDDNSAQVGRAEGARSLPCGRDDKKRGDIWSGKSGVAWMKRNVIPV